MDFERLKKEIESGKFAPLYYFYGDEAYFIDKLTRLIEDTALNPGEEAFNKVVMYGNDTKSAKLLGELRSFPMMSNRRLVVLKEAQSMNKADFKNLDPYLENPAGTTVFVMAFKGGKKLDGRSKAVKAIKDKGVVFESKKLYDNQVSSWIRSFIQSKGYQIDPDAIHVLVTYLGTSLGLVESEIEKIFLSLEGKAEKMITRNVVFEMINIDKDFNVFELMNSLGARDHARSHFIINQMMRNVKENPPVLVVYQLFQFFDKLTLVQSKKLTNENDIARELNLHRFIAKEYVQALRHYNLRTLQRNLVYVLEADLFLKGIQQTHMGDDHVLKTLIYKLLN